MNKAGKSNLKVLVTGADGFVGRALVDHLHSNPRMTVYAGVHRIRNRHTPRWACPGIGR